MQPPAKTVCRAAAPPITGERRPSAAEESIIESRESRPIPVRRRWGGASAESSIASRFRNAVLIVVGR